MSIQIINKKVNISEKEFEVFRIIFETFLISYEGIYCLSHSRTKKIFNELLIEDNCYLNKKQLHVEIAEQLNKTQTSVRKLEEEIFNLFAAKQYFNLNKIISDIEYFLLLYTSNNKFQLFRYWQKLEEQEYDPSIEYNKALEAFEMHYHPSNEDLFQIIFQMSRFLRDFGDFETIFTPNFMHPPILGKQYELMEIGLYEELEKMQLQDRTKELKDKKKNEKIIQKLLMQKQLELEQEMQDQQKQQQTGQAANPNKDVSQQVQQSLQTTTPIMIHQQNYETPEEETIDIKRLNVDIPNNYQTVRQYFINKMKNECVQVQQFLDNDLDETGTNNDDNSFDQNQSMEDLKGNYQKMQTKKLGKTEKLIYKQNIINEDDLQTYYYYKRFLWMIFPLACISNKQSCNYSNQIKRCYISHTEYLSVTEEKLHTKKALLLILEAHLKKRQTYEKQEVLQSLIQYLQQFKQDLQNLNQQCIDEQNVEQTPRNDKRIKQKIQMLNELNTQKNNPVKPKILLNNNNNNNNNNVFLTADDKDQTYINKNNKFQKLDAIQNGDHYSSISIFNKSKIFGMGVMSFRAEFTKLNEQSQDNENRLILPRLKQQINQHSQTEINTLLSKNIYFVKEYNGLKYTNVQKEKELANLILQSNKLSGPKDQEEKKIIQNKIEQNTQNLTKLDNNYKNSLKLKERMNKIIQICKQNTKQNKVYVRDLNQLLGNYQKLINIQKMQIQQSAKELVEQQKLNEELYEICFQRMNNQTELIQQIKSDLVQKQIFDNKYINADGVIEQSIMQQINEDTQKINNTILKQKLKNRKNEQKNLESLEEKCIDLETNYETMCEILELEQMELMKDQDFKKSDKFKIFMMNQAEINKIRSLNLLKQDELEQIKKKVADQKYDLNYMIELQKITNGNGEEYDDMKEMSKNDLLYEVKHQRNLNQNAEQQFQKNKQKKINIEIALESIYYKLKLINDLKNDFVISDCNISDVLSNMEEKLAFIKSVLPEEKYKKLMDKNFNRGGDIIEYLRLK